MLIAFQDMDYLAESDKERFQNMQDVDKIAEILPASRWDFSILGSIGPTRFWVYGFNYWLSSFYSFCLFIKKSLFKYLFLIIWYGYLTMRRYFVAWRINDEYVLKN